MSTKTNADNYKHVSYYIDQVASKFKLGFSSEHTFRKDLEVLINSLAPEVSVTNEPSQITDCGNPDFLISKKHIPIGFIEAKDVGKNLNSKQYNEQFDRYKSALDNLIITDYLHFQFFISGELVHEVNIGEVLADKEKSISGIEKNYERFAELLKDFCIYVGQTIKSAQRLAILMAGKARLLENTLYNAVISDEDTGSNTDLREQYQTFKSVLIHDLTPSEFADIYAQTLAYGMFAARLHDDDLETFSRQEASERIPKTNPFLRRLFDSVAGTNIDDRIKLTVDNLAEVFRATDVAAILKNFGKTTQTQDPIIHFYETFLAEYNPKLRKQRGVWYTPEPVVKFIVRAVDDILKSEFNLADGIADTSKVEIEKQTQTRDSRTKTGFKTIKELVHKVQILDPATGTGTFLAAIIQHIFHSQFENMGGIWSSYVEQDLLPRLHGFELLMASYAMAHLKLDMLLTDTGYQPIKPKRLQVYLTNSLEEHHPDTGTLFAGWLSNEANEANAIKRDTPVMVVVGNPPYSAISTNNSEWIMSLMDDFKKEPGGKEKLQEKNSKMINDDYVKFIRQAQHFIEKNEEGVLAFINPHGFLSSDTFRGMRWQLLKAFDKIYTIDLHGNTKKDLSAQLGFKDENVFDITQGVSINLFVKTTKSTELAEMNYFSLPGGRETKYEFLKNKSLSEIKFEKIAYRAPDYYLFPIDYDSIDIYENSFSLSDLYNFTSTGLQTDNDNFCIDFDKRDIVDKVHDLSEYPTETVRAKYELGKDTSSWSLKNAIADVKASPSNTDAHCKINYRPFDIRESFYTGNSNGFMGRPRRDLVQHLFKRDNYSLITVKKSRSSGDWNLIHIGKEIPSKPTAITSLDANYIFPLYLYPDGDSSPNRVPNLDEETLNKIIKDLGLEFIPDHDSSEAGKANSFTPLDLLDYIYAILHNLTYRKTYKEFLKIDFPRVPYPSNTAQFWQLVDLGGQLRKVHLLESSSLVEQLKLLSLKYPEAGDNKVTRKMTKASIGFEPNENNKLIGKVWINDKQYFDNIPLVSWDFEIGGYQPAQKWLKDRQDIILNMTDIKHYMNIIASLSLTDKLMKEIDEIDVVG